MGCQKDHGFTNAAVETGQANATVTKLWHNKWLETAWGVCQADQSEWWAQLAATVQTIGDLLWSHAELIEPGLSLRTILCGGDDQITDRVRSAGWFHRGASQPALAVGNWVSSSDTDVYHLQEWGWEHHRRQNLDREMDWADATGGRDPTARGHLARR